MISFRWMLLGVALGFSTSFVSCGATSKCSPTTCQFGCCDASGTCQTGASDSQCGNAGAMCQSCGLGRICQIGQCVASGPLGGGTGSTTGGGSGGTTGGGSGGTTGGGSGGTTGGGSGGTTGGGSGGTTGGGSGGTTGGGSGGTTGGGSGGTTGGGSGGGIADTCAALSAGVDTFFSGRTDCGTLSKSSNFAMTCPSMIAPCNMTDQSVLKNFATCLAQTPCTAGNETSALNQYHACIGAAAVDLSPSCAVAVNATPPDAGTPQTCTVMTSFPQARTSARIDTLSNTPEAFVSASATDPSDVLQFNFYGASTPFTENFANFTWTDCTNCVVLGRSCTGSSCSGGLYLARTGTITVSGVPTAVNMTAPFVASMGPTTFQEWDLMANTAVQGGRCFALPPVSINVAP